ncbi:tRNA (N(6)-L-threonylcarbamoyladenosine(37)-C(2))-methylthiotransferase MtaB [Treponema sp. TIM-1]|uniref:tRNA (N(6)-L-threonylcarbamoyladenosine(37)-C(2))- methylthiotransferase MtaB n=1 Tax=Treponema sp. TIM-1 TaxID=2898417 RepID=UPI0039812CE8
MFSIALQTLGCKLNQFESESIAGAFNREGFTLVPWEGGGADIFLVNTCTVTSKAEQKARRTIRKILKENPEACVIVTGCYAQVEAEAVAGLMDHETGAWGYQKRLFVVPGDHKSSLLDLPKFLVDFENPAAALEQWTRRLDISSPQDRFRFNPETFFSHSRAFLKIQDGCNNRCSYCRVTLARGPSVSLAAERVLSRLRVLETAGFGEAVLTGINICQYRDGALDLRGLLEYLLKQTQGIALRVSSVEPENITRDLVNVLGNPRIRPHFHLSIQSGSPHILKKMGRTYSPESIEEGVALLRSVKGDPFFACDIITGFPGETGEEFEKTYELCRRLGFSWIHAFPYSPRPGTEAYHFTGPVSEREAISRVKALTDLAHQGRRDYVRRWIGKKVEAIIEGTAPDNGKNKKDSPYTAALSDNYLRLLLPSGELPPPHPGKVVPCRIRALDETGGDLPGISRFDAWGERLPLK